MFKNDVNLELGNEDTKQSFFVSPDKKGVGGRTTISPPLNGKHENDLDIRSLASNVDTLNLTIDIRWECSEFLHYLGKIKKIASASRKELPVILKDPGDKTEHIFNLKQHGSRGYEWILYNSEYSLLIGRWLEPKNKPSVIVEFRSETLWRTGPLKSIQRLIRILDDIGANIKSIKLSRIDLCVDLLIPKDIWSKELINFKVSKSKVHQLHFNQDVFTGISFGRGTIRARLYDKPLEIKQKSGKNWMYEVWGFKEVPEGYKIIRVEFQLRREAIKDLGLNTYMDLFEFYENIWSYCTKKWLLFKDNPGKHQVHQRNVLGWWRIVQNGFLGMQDENPLIRCKAINAKEKQLFIQAFGFLTSMKALDLESNEVSWDYQTSIKQLAKELPILAKNMGKTDDDINREIIEKRAKFVRSREKLNEANKLRENMGLRKDKI